MRAEQSITISSTIAVPIEEAWLSWADEGRLSAWFTTNARQTFREGGAYENGDGDAGVFTKIVPNSTIQFTWDNKDHSPGSLVTVSFSRVDPTSTRVTICHEGLVDETCAKDMSTGWTWALASARSYLETGKPISYEDWKNREVEA